MGCYNYAKKIYRRVTLMKKGTVEAILSDLEHADPSTGWKTFAEILRWELEFFDRLAKAARSRAIEGIRKVFEDEVSPYALGGWNVSGGGEGRWLRYFWGILFPEDFEWKPSIVGGKPVFFQLKEGVPFGERESRIIYGLLTSPSGLAYIFDQEMRRFRAQFAERPPWPEEVEHKMERLFGSLSFCPSPGCGKFFVATRQGQRFCSDPCRKRAHEVPSTERKDPKTVHIYFWRKVDEGYSREDAWKATLERHGAKLKELGLDGPKPPASWAKKGGR